MQALLVDIQGLTIFCFFLTGKKVVMHMVEDRPINDEARKILLNPPK